MHIGSQQIFTCNVTGPEAVWTNTGLNGATNVGTSGQLDINKEGITTNDSRIPTENFTITITGCTTTDNGGIVLCIDIQGLANVSAGVCVCVCACVRACVCVGARACVCLHVYVGLHACLGTAI